MERCGLQRRLAPASVSAVTTPRKQHVSEKLSCIHNCILQLAAHCHLLLPRPVRTKAGRWCVGRRALTLSPQIVFRLMPAVWRAGWQQGDQVVWGSLGLLVIIIISNNTTCSSTTPWQPAGCVSARGCMRGRGNSQTVAVGSQARANESATDRCKVALGARQRQ